MPDPLLAAEQFAALTKGMGDLERRFGLTPDPEADRKRIEGAVEVFMAAYGPRDNPAS
ncbi:MAG: TetR/AcrR family transcriptional regulator C-terminal domain-containing protein [Erythrobacter sp.]